MFAFTDLQVLKLVMPQRSVWNDRHASFLINIFTFLFHRSHIYICFYTTTLETVLFLSWSTSHRICFFDVDSCESVSSSLSHVSSFSSCCLRFNLFLFTFHISPPLTTKKSLNPLRNCIQGSLGTTSIYKKLCSSLVASW